MFGLGSKPAAGGPPKPSVGGAIVDWLFGDASSPVGAYKDAKKQLLLEQLADRLAGQVGGAPAGSPPQAAPTDAAPSRPGGFPVDPVADAAGGVVADLQNGSLGATPKLDLPKVSVPDLGAAAPVGVPQRPAGGNVYREMLPDFIHALGQGVDPTPLAAIARTEGYRGGVPEQDRALYDLDPLDYAKQATELGIPQIFNTRRGLVSVDKRTHEPSLIYEAPADPMSVNDVIGGILEKVASGVELTPGEQKVYERWHDGTLPKPRGGGGGRSGGGGGGGGSGLPAGFILD